MLCTGLFISSWNMLENWLMPQLNENNNDYIFQQDGSPAHYKYVRGYLNRNVNAVATTVPGFNPVRLFFLGGLWRTLSLCLHSPLISTFSQPYHRCCGSGRPWFTDTGVERDGLSLRCLPYYQMWTYWASVKYVKKNLDSFSLSIGVRTTVIRWVAYLLRIFKMFHGFMNNPV